ncbi:unnamed protein product, partial [marine sediment metagenome]
DGKNNINLAGIMCEETYTTIPGLVRETTGILGMAAFFIYLLGIVASMFLIGSSFIKSIGYDS